MKLALAMSVLAVPALAQEPRTFQLKDGTQLRAEVISVQDGSATLKSYFGGGSGQITRKLADFDPRSAFQLMLTVTPTEDVDGQLKLADYAVDNGLVAAAESSFRRARLAAKGKTLPAELEASIPDRAIGTMEKALNLLISQGKTKDAELILSKIMNTPTPRISDERKAAFVEKWQSAVDTAQMRAKADRAARAQTAAEQARQKQVTDLENKLAKAREYKKQGLLAGKSQGAAKDSFNRAVAVASEVAASADTLIKKNANDATLVADLQGVKQAAIDEQASSLLHQASIDMIRSSFNSALGSVNRVLAIDPNNSQALAMRARIEIAANSDDWGY